MSVRTKTIRVVFSVLAAAACASLAQAQTAETFTATATVKGAGGGTASVPVTITVDRKMPQSEADAMIAAYKSGGTAGLRKALAGVKPTGSVTLGDGKPTPTRLTLERTTDKGRLLTIVSDRPLLFIGAGMPEAKPKEGYDFGVIDIVVDEKGAGKGTMSPAAKVTLKDGAFVVDDYANTNPVELASVTKVK